MAGTPAGRPSLLITGAAGGLANTVTTLLGRDYDLVGVDARPMPSGQKFAGTFYRLDYSKRQMAEVFRNHKFLALLHLGRLPITSNDRESTRYHLNVLGTRNLLELAQRYGVNRVVVVSTFHVYGAHPHNHLHMTEEDPLRASQTFPEISDAVEMDNLTTQFLLKHPEMRITLLRPVNVIGPTTRNRICSMFRNSRVPVMLGYDPLQQFVQERDFARAIQLALEGSRSGVYNVAGEGVIPFVRAVELAGSAPVPVPHFMLYPLIAAAAPFGLHFPKHLLDFFRFPTIISDAAFRRDFDYAPEILTVQALKSIRQGRPLVR